MLCRLLMNGPPRIGTNASRGGRVSRRRRVGRRVGQRLLRRGIPASIAEPGRRQPLSCRRRNGHGRGSRLVRRPRHSAVPRCGRRRPRARPRVGVSPGFCKGHQLLGHARPKADRHGQGNRGQQQEGIKLAVHKMRPGKGSDRPKCHLVADRNPGPPTWRRDYSAYLSPIATGIPSGPGSRRVPQPLCPKEDKHYARPPP